MADSDYSVIKPIESLPTVHGVEPTKRRQERKRRQPAPNRRHEEPETEETPEPEARRNDDDPHSIDYCA